MRVGMRRGLRVLGAAVALAGVLAFQSAQAAHDDGFTAKSVLDNRQALQQAIQSNQRVLVIIQLVDPPLATYTGGINNIAGTKPEPGSKLDLTTDNARAYLQYLGGRQTAFITALRSVAPTARVVDMYQIVFNGVAAEIDGIHLPGVLATSGVREITLSVEFRPTMNVSLPLIQASSLWQAVGGSGGAGRNMFIGIIDTGIDIRNPFFADQGYQTPFGFPKTDNEANKAFTNRKVVVARAYPNPSVSTVDSARDTNGHGSHVAGTSAGNLNTQAVAQGVPFRISGVAPRAYLGNYNVFPNSQASARSVDIIAALDDAVSDGMDVVNMSLGGVIGIAGISTGLTAPNDVDALAIATNNTVEAGVIAAVAAGNSGPGASTITSPGIARNAITSGASTNPHFVGQPVNVTGPGNVPAELTNLGGAAGQFEIYASTTAAPFAWWAGQAEGPGTACSDRGTSGNLAPPDPTPAVSVAGKIALIARGDCTFTSKIRNAQTAGAIGVLLYNNVAGDPVAMGHDGSEPKPTIPALMISNPNGRALRDWYRQHNAATARVDPGFAEVRSANADIIAGFSSRGPTDLEFLLKPEVTSPGVNILSAINSATGFALFQGTSMASPHTAGAAALLKQRFPGWSPLDVKSALVATAKRPVTDHVTGQAPTGVMTRGGGRIDLQLAADPRVTSNPATLGLGVVTPATTIQRDIVLTDTGKGSSWTFAVTAPARPNGSSAAGVTVAVSPASAAIAGARRTTIRVTFAVAVTASGQYEGDIVLTGPVTLRIPYWLSVGPP